MDKKPKFKIGQKVTALVSKRGCYEPSFCNVGEKMTIDKIEKRGNSFYYTCGYNGYEFKENEIKK